MKRFLSAVAGIAFVGTTAVAPAVAFPSSSSSTQDSQMLLNVETLSEDEMMTLDAFSGILEVTPDHLLSNPSELNRLAGGESDGSSDMLGTYTVDGCSVKAGCAISAIGLILAMQCSSSGVDPEAWAYCVQEKDEDAYAAAKACTFGDCPFASVPDRSALACTEPGMDSRLLFAKL